MLMEANRLPERTAHTQPLAPTGVLMDLKGIVPRELGGLRL